ncbi:hypothetical protein CN582_24820 [Bacillus wiedmannii]|uniref:hypothetical protein n=1 Tax=Bacillus wiedmannii TaxID=1890302 RepID=UPI000BF935A1|nr:hypothetical protein [Bacillus wiedmannii]PEP92376.1 hypothetical protein CN582_24820 [Bacillus wiedmannii]
MDLDTKKFIKIIDGKLKISMKEVDEIIQYYGKETTSQSVRSVLENISIMRKLIDIYILLEKKSIPELEQLQEEVFSVQTYIESEHNKLIGSLSSKKVI